MSNFMIDRRTLLKGAGASLALAALNASGMNVFNFDKKLRVGLIGTGWYGKSDLFRLMQVAPIDVIALCDVDKNKLEEAATMVMQRSKAGKPRLYGDYRKMLAESGLDIVLIGTPDHWHALQTIEALRTGANVYVQKPISVDVI
ncbi:MAG: Gfo/Idh/MocA family oxidoreductase, partial [Ginsengibacter sp.]